MPRFNHRPAECLERKKAQKFKVDGAKVKKVGMGMSSDESGNNQVRQRKMAVLLTENVLIQMA